jgi:hypothetical protein
MLNGLVELSKLAMKLSRLYEKLHALEEKQAKASHELFVQIQETMNDMDAILIEEVLGEDLSSERD